MTDDASALQATWMSDVAASEDSLRDAVDRVLERDRADRVRERRLRIGGLIAMLLLVPALVWAAAYGVAPLVRAAYALMAAGCVAGLTAEWLYLTWSRLALPGPADTRSQLQTTAFMLNCQVWLARTAAAWSSPVFVGVVLICAWLYRERTVAGAATLCVLSVVAWIGTVVLALRAAARLDRRKRRLEQLLAALDH